MLDNIQKLNNELPLPIELDSDFVDILRNYNSYSKINRKNYRDKMNELYDNINYVKPIDNINDVIYFNNYDEVGIVVNKNDVSLKQIWTEYRLIFNEKVKESDNVMEDSFVLDNFDVLYDKLNKKVDGFDKYVNELNSLKKEIDNDNGNLKTMKESLEKEKMEFANYRVKEIERLNKLELEVNDKLNRVNELIKKLDEKMEQISD